jgi:hypothetical protein
VPRNLRVALALGVCLIALTLYPADLSAVALAKADAAAQRGRGHVRVARPVVYAGGWYAPYSHNPFWSYGWWGPWGWPGGYRGAGFVATSSARVQVTPRQTEVYVDGYLAGTVDDFDGFAQRLRVAPGDHVIELYLDGHRTISQSIYFQPGETYQLRHTMEPLGSGETETRPVPHPAGVASVPAGPRRRGPSPPRGPGTRDREVRAGEAGTLVIRIQPDDAEVFIDGERWETSGGQRLDVQVSPGQHRIEVRKDGYQPFTTTIEVRPGESTPLNVSLARPQG